MKPEKNKEEEQDFLSLLAEKGGFAPIKHNHKEIDVIDLDRIRWKGKFTKGQEYKVNDLVSYQGNLYICMTDNKGQAPTTNFWELVIKFEIKYQNKIDFIGGGGGGSGGSGVSDHALLTNLAYAGSGHTGFLPSSHLTDFTHADIAHTNRTALDFVSGVNTGDQDLSSYAKTGDNVSTFVNDAGYLTSFTETDPIFTASPAHGIDAFDIANWNTAYGWGNHAGLYELTGTASGLIGTHESTYDHTLIATALQSLDGAWLNDTNQTDLTGDKSGSFDLTTTGNLAIRSDTGYIDLGATANDYKIQWNGSDAVHTIKAGDFVFTGGSVGIGTTTPSQKLDIVGNINIDGSSAYLYAGHNAIKLATKGDTVDYTSTIIGRLAGDNVTDGTTIRQTAVGYFAGYVNTRNIKQQ